MYNLSRSIRGRSLLMFLRLKITIAGLKQISKALILLDCKKICLKLFKTRFAV